MVKIGKYIYGIISSNPSTSFGISPEQSRRANTRESVGPYGISVCPECSDSSSFTSGSRRLTTQNDSIRDKDVHFIPYQDIAAVVSDSEIIDYNHMFKDALARGLVEHQKIIERIMGIGYSIIPMRLGTFAMNEEEVKDILNKGYVLIKEIIPKISDKIEIDVVAAWSDFTSVIKEAGEEKEIKDYKEKLLSSPKGITVDDQMKIGFMLKKALDEKREKYALKIQDILRTVSIDSKTHELMDDKMVANFAFLLDKLKQKEFYAKVEDLNTEFAEKLNFRCVGPLPAYSFYSLEIKKMQFNDVDWARKRLGILNDVIGKDEIKKIFHRQAFISHPDKNPDRPEAERDFDEIKKSYDLLLDFAQACAQAGQERLVFNEDEFSKNAVLVKVREDISYGAKRT